MLTVNTVSHTSDFTQSLVLPTAVYFRNTNPKLVSSIAKDKVVVSRL